jgi:hypothetical protein
MRLLGSRKEAEIVIKIEKKKQKKKEKQDEKK